MPPPAAAPKPGVQRPHWRDVLATSMSTYLPATLMALLAAGTWWLVRNTPVPQAPREPRPVQHEIDYEMQRFTVRRFTADGLQRAIVEGSTLRHYVDDDSSEIDAVRVRGIDEVGRRMRAQAARGHANSGQTEVKLTGQARVVREALANPDPTAERKLGDGQLELLGETLWIYPEAQRVRSDEPVTVLTESGRVDAGSLEYYGRQGVTQMGGGVRGHYQEPPRPAALPPARGAR